MMSHVLAASSRDWGWGIKKFQIFAYVTFTYNVKNSYPHFLMKKIRFKYCPLPKNRYYFYSKSIVINKFWIGNIRIFVEDLTLYYYGRIMEMYKISMSIYTCEKAA